MPGNVKAIIGAHSLHGLTISQYHNYGQVGLLANKMLKQMFSGF